MDNWSESNTYTYSVDTRVLHITNTARSNCEWGKGQHKLLGLGVDGFSIEPVMEHTCLLSSA